MPVRHLCPAYEAGDACADPLCLHADDGTQYLFESPLQVMLFSISPQEIQNMICLLCDAGFDDNDPRD